MLRIGILIKVPSSKFKICILEVNSLSIIEKKIVNTSDMPKAIIAQLKAEER